MKPHHNFAQALTNLRTTAVVTIACAIASGFWLLTGSSGLAGVSPNECQVCHKRTTTLTLACNSLDYQRHLDHGDPPRACAPTMTAVEPIGKGQIVGTGVETTPSGN